MSGVSSAAADWLIGVFIVAALYLLVRPGSPAAGFVNSMSQLIAALVGVAGGGPGTDPIIRRNG